MPAPRPGVAARQGLSARCSLGAWRCRVSSLMPPASSSSALLATHPRAQASRQRSLAGRNPRCKASRHRRCLSASSRNDNTAGGAVPRQPRGRSANGHGAARVVPGEQGKAADRRQGGALLREANTAMRCPPPAPRGTGPAARLASSSRSSDEHRIAPRSFPRHASRLASVAAPFHPRIGPRAQGIGGHLLCCGSSTMAPHRPPRRASHRGV